jgi:hypothetical protein
MRSRSPLRLAAALLLALGWPAARTPAQECPQGRISFIFIDNWSIFDTSEMDPDARFRWAYRLANNLHVRTREEFIRSELLFRTGDCLDPLLLEESERLLRAYRFISSSDVYSVAQPDGTHHVVVDTQDEWTTRLDMGFRLDEGVRIQGIDATEENLLGRGILARVFYHEEKEQRDLGMEFQTPRVGDTRWDARVSFGNTRTGQFFEEALVYPFLGEIGRLAGRQNLVRRETLFSYALPPGSPYTHLWVPFLEEHWDMALGGRVGRPGNLTVFGAGVSSESVRFRSFPEDLELVERGDFSTTVPADSLRAAAVRDQARDRSSKRANFFFGQRNLAFLQRSGLDALRGTQDVAVGTEVLVGLGRSLNAVQGGGSPSPDDLHTQLTLFHGGAWDGWTLNTRLYTEGRWVRRGGGSPAGWEDVFAEADAFLYWQPGVQGSHTVLFRASAAGGWSVRTPFQLTLGGRFGVRGFRDERFPGGRRIILTLEERMYLPWPAPELFDFGLTAFLDAGLIRAGEVPFGSDSGWRAALGGGVRFGLPPGTSNMARIDLALPLGRRVQLNDIVLRVTLQEVLGILPGILDEQLMRSLRSGVRPYLIAVPW